MNISSLSKLMAGSIDGRRAALHFIAAALALPMLLGCSGDKECDPCRSTPLMYSFSFEDSFEGWTAKATDVDHPSVTWSIKRSTAIASEETTSVELYLENFNDAGKIWIERGFEVKPATLYHVHLAYDFASSDWGIANHWRIIAGVIDHPAAVWSDLVFQGDTANGSDSDQGFVWLDKAYSFDLRSNSHGMLYIIIGVWGVWETPRTYYLDAVGIEFIEE
jgi:hypothetical protein